MLRSVTLESRRIISMSKAMGLSPLGAGNQPAIMRGEGPGSQEGRLPRRVGKSRGLRSLSIPSVVTAERLFQFPGWKGARWMG